MVIMHVFNPFIPFEVCKLSSFHFPIRLVIFIMPPGSGVGVPYPKDIKIKKVISGLPNGPGAAPSISKDTATCFLQFNNFFGFHFQNFGKFA